MQCEPAQTDRANKFLIVVYGCPASGKTTFTRNMLNLLGNCLLASTDNLEKRLLACPTLITCLPQMNVQQCLELIRGLGKEYNFETAKPKFDCENWRRSRKLMEQLVAKIVNSHNLILEDDLLLRSQRRVYRKIAWKAQIRYLEIYMDSTIDECFQNVKQRNQKTGDCVITEEVILKSMSKIETQADQFTWQLKLSQRDQVKAQDIFKRLRKVQIIPNDPNHEEISTAHKHTQIQLREIQVRNYIHLLMTMESQNLESELGPEIVGLNKLYDRKVCAKVLSEWKKYITKSTKDIVNIKLKQNLLSYLRQSC